MGYLASDISKVPTNFKWYVLVLEDVWNDKLREELTQNFETFSSEVGSNVLVVRGLKPAAFYDTIVSIYDLPNRLWVPNKKLHYPPPPALLITDTSPSLLLPFDAERNIPRDVEPYQNNLKIILLPLAENFVRPGSITEILKQLSITLRSDQLLEALSSQNTSVLSNAWSWFTHYFEVKPNFLGFGVNILKLVDDLFKNVHRE